MEQTSSTALFSGLSKDVDMKLCSEERHEIYDALPK